MIYVFSSRPSRSARSLARALKGRRISSQGDIHIGTSGTVINWGDSSCPFKNAINKPDRVAVATNKLRCFNALATSGVSIPRFAARKDCVSWKGTTVVRHKLQGHSGDGIEIVEGKDFPNAPLYVEYIKKSEEYRVHVIGDQVVLVQRKARRRDVPDERVDWKVRNHSNGFIFQRNEVSCPESVTRSAIDAIRALSLDFGAVDLILGKTKTYVLEINTAPGMEGSTVNDYREGFKRLLSL